MAACVLVDRLGWVLQFALGLLAFFILIFKRYQESPRRSWRIWSFDTSKQALVSAEIHLINVALARAMMEHGHTNDSCGWYFTMVLLDSTIGLVSVYFLLKWSSWFVHRHRISILYSGEYGTPPRWKPWFAQLLLYNTVMLIEKGLVSLLLLLHFVQRVGGAILTPIGNVSPTLELVLALVLTPFLINVMWFWIVDNFLMKGDDSQRSSYKFSTLQQEIGTPPHSPQSPASSLASYELSTFERLLEDDGDSSDGDELIYSGASPHRE
eukprot:m.15441 g.15441  ORF g.15441 m.15441 type:complete len:267 (+) comp4915_c0_seq1:424-1224(+)